MVDWPIIMEVKYVIVYLYLLRNYTPLRLANLKRCYDSGAWPWIDVKDR